MATISTTVLTNTTLSSTGVTIDSLNDIITQLITNYQAIYGTDIITDSNTPDGQLINIFAQAIEDMLEFVQSVYNSFDPDNAQGVTLDARCAINNVFRTGATYTYQDVTITTDRAVFLQGLDADASSATGTGYTVADNNGNQFILLDSQTITIAGSYTFSFRAADLGSITTLPDTITEPVSVVEGVTTINNSTSASSIGQDEETDAELRTRRQQSVANGSAGYLNGLIGNLLAVTDVVDAVVYENYTDATDDNGIPAHSIWAIVEGGANTDIGTTIYDLKAPGCGMKGDVSVNITTDSGAIFTALFSRPSSINLYISFNIQTTVNGQSFDTTGIQDYMVSNLSYGIGDFADTSSITAVALAAINSTSGGGVPTDVLISSDGISYSSYIVPNVDEIWSVSADNIAITILT